MSFLHFFAKPIRRHGPLVFMLIAASYLRFKTTQNYYTAKLRQEIAETLGELEANLSSNVVLAAEFTITSTSSAITSHKSSSNPRLDSQILPTTGTNLLNTKAWKDFPWVCLRHLKSSVFMI